MATRVRNGRQEGSGNKKGLNSRTTGQLEAATWKQNLEGKEEQKKKKKKKKSPKGRDLNEPIACPTPFFPCLNIRHWENTKNGTVLIIPVHASCGTARH